MGIGHHLNVPIIAVSSAIEYPWMGDFIGNNDNPAVVPNALYMAFGKMSFWQRLVNTVTYHDEKRKFHRLTEDVQTELMRKYINPDLPNIRDVEKSVALTLVNSHPIIYGVKPVLPTLVQIGGLHVEENDSVLSTVRSFDYDSNDALSSYVFQFFFFFFSKDLKIWLDESVNGVVYFTFGSMVLVETLPELTLKIFYASFAKIAPVRVLIKIADENKLPFGLPKNIKILPWVPQQAILGKSS